MKTRNSHGLLQLGREALAYCQCASALISRNKALLVSVDLIGEKNQVILEYMLNCSFFTDARKSLLPMKFVRRPNILQFSNLMSCKKQSSLKKICTFIRKVNNELPV